MIFNRYQGLADPEHQSRLPLMKALVIRLLVSQLEIRVWALIVAWNGLERGGKSSKLVLRDVVCYDVSLCFVTLDFPATFDRSIIPRPEPRANPKRPVLLFASIRCTSRKKYSHSGPCARMLWPCCLNIVSLCRGRIMHSYKPALLNCTLLVCLINLL